ncbi:hypothetical protein L211DRAFT_845236 [Terfezia boudieri ATCC MYA-4762]|uniref:Lytic polysaccharide monooxygenase n=1 Tax=Terfezia boudieri ATCC MYA-4762 TaxID=1051890 RepID=A0A3N4M241_9PEZI|nr:hypothetical protein L211DRAFT_845236 [Terfezia boudieri ATCC MYA-4762]
MSLRTTNMLIYLIAMYFIFALNVSAHMVMSEPPPINYKTSPYYDVSKADFDYTAPLSPSGSNYPCRGMLKYLGTTVAQSVRTYSPGGTYELKFDGSATHAGGSCQVSLSYDQGATWKAFKSFIGGCVGIQPGGSQAFQFTIPSDAPQGEALFGWTWFNHEGNREMYMNCAVVTIGSSKKLAKRSLSGPDMFIANIGNGCSTAAGKDVYFPLPGSDVQFGGNAANQAAPIGNCGKVLYSPPPTNTGGNTGGNTGNTGNLLPPKVVSSDVRRESPKYTFPATTLDTLPEPTPATPKDIPDTLNTENPPSTSNYRNPLPVVTNISGNNQGGTNTPTTTNDGNGGNNVPNPTNTYTTTSPTSKPNEGLVGGNEGLSKDCAYWKSQGYTCSGAISSLGLGVGSLWWKAVPLVAFGAVLL